MQEGSDRWARATGRAGAWAAARLPAAGRSASSHALALIGWTPEGYAARKVGLAAFGAVFVPLLTAVLAATGVRLPVAVPLAGSLALASVLFLVVDLVVRDQAAAARVQMRRALCSYLDLVSLRRDASEGPTIALERAAAPGGGGAAGRGGGAGGRAGRFLLPGPGGPGPGRRGGPPPRPGGAPRRGGGGGGRGAPPPPAPPRGGRPPRRGTGCAGWPPTPA